MSRPAPSDLIVHSTEPFNAEPSLGVLRSNFITPIDCCYIRSHGDVPRLDPTTHHVRVEGLVGKRLELTVDDLKGRFEHRSVTAVIQCAGNRRAGLQHVEPTSGDPWSAGAIANIRWTGVSLADVLRAADAKLDPAFHVALEAMDIAWNDGAPDAPYAVSIPMPKATCPDVLLAWAMNDEPLTREHGAPLRVIVPGYAGVRSIKWISRIAVQERACDAFQQRHDYLLFPPSMRKETEDIACGMVINEMPLNAAICEPGAGATLPVGPTLVRGYAIATDRAITRVDISKDGGQTWLQATLEDHGNERWSWTFWSARIDLQTGRHEIVVRAWDAAGQTQPASPSETWNFRGYLNAAWHRVTVRVV